MKLLGGAALAALAVVLSGCASNVPPPSTEIATDSVPGFLAEPQDDLDIPAADLSDLGIAPESTRYQGEVEGILIYLAVRGERGVHVVQVDEDDPASWSAGTSVGDNEFGFSPMATGIEMQYLPQGTADLPEGWDVFSAWIATAG